MTLRGPRLGQTIANARGVGTAQQGIVESSAMTLRQYLNERTRGANRFAWLVGLPLVLGWAFAPRPFNAAFLVGFFAYALATYLRVRRMPCPRCGGNIGELALAYYGTIAGKFRGTRRARLEALDPRAADLMGPRSGGAGGGSST